MMTNEELWKKIVTGLDKLTPKSMIGFDVHIVEHCNLNCKQCDNFSPLAEEEYLDVDSYKKDCEQISRLFEGELDYITLLGGEPLLHPQIIEFMRISREAFPVGHITIVTNGLLLPSMSEDFWEACRTYDVTIRATLYPVKFDYDGLKKLAASKGVKYFTFHANYAYDEDNTVRTFRKDFPIVTQGRTSRRFENFFTCQTCIILQHGRIYPCPIAAYAPHLKNYFNLDIHLSEKDGVDIYSVKSGDELLEKLARPIPFCQYCDVTDEKITTKWEISRKDRYEWLAFSFTKDDIQYLKSRKPVLYIFGAGVWGERAVALLKNEGISIKSVLCTRKKEGVDSILDVPIVPLDEIGEVEPDSICLVALSKVNHKDEVYPLLSEINFGDIVPICNIIPTT